MKRQAKYVPALEDFANSGMTVYLEGWLAEPVKIQFTVGKKTRAVYEAVARGENWNERLGMYRKLGSALGAIQKNKARLGSDAHGRPDLYEVNAYVVQE